MGVPVQGNASEMDDIEAQALDAVTDALQWQLAEERWRAIRRVLAAMTAAQKSGDLVALADATARLELAGPLRVIPIETMTGPPPPVRDLLNNLVHVLGGVTADPSHGSDRAGAANADASHG